MEAGNGKKKNEMNGCVDENKIPAESMASTPQPVKEWICLPISFDLE